MVDCFIKVTRKELKTLVYTLLKENMRVISAVNITAKYLETTAQWE